MGTKKNRRVDRQLCEQTASTAPAQRKGKVAIMNPTSQPHRTCDGDGSRPRPARPCQELRCCVLAGRHQDGCTHASHSQLDAVRHVHPVRKHAEKHATPIHTSGFTPCDAGRLSCKTPCTLTLQSECSAVQRLTGQQREVATGADYACALNCKPEASSNMPARLAG